MTARQNDFIKNTLKSNSQALHSFSETLLTSVSGFTDNTRDQAAATEEVTASIEEIAAGIESVKTNVDHPFSSISELSATVTGVASAMKAMVAAPTPRCNRSVLFRAMPARERNPWRS